MAEIIPFRGLRYNQERIKRLDAVVTPPYDVISPERQTQLYKSNRHNFIRVILGKENRRDNQAHNRYTRARDFLQSWVKRGFMVKDGEPALYIYEQAYDFKGKKLSRLGFIGLLKLERPGKGAVFPHEKTFCKPKEDRLNLLKTVKANLCPIFSVYIDNNFQIDRLLHKYSRSRPLQSLRFEGVENRLWRIDDKSFIQRVVSLMSDKNIFIADGHHRYEAARLYRKLIGKTQNRGADKVMMYFCNLKSEGLKILPTHRVVRHIPEDTLGKLIPLLSRYFIVQEYSSRKELFCRLEAARGSACAFGLYLGNKRFYLLTLIKKKVKCVPMSGMKCYSRLDVVLLHDLIFDKLLGIKEEKPAGIKLLYTRDESEAVALVKGRKYQAAFFMNPPEPSQVSAIAIRLKTMPHKSTYFYPKPISGLVINQFEAR